MGLFPDEYAVTTATTTQPVIDDDAISDPIKQMALKAALSGTSFLAAYRSEIMAGFGRKVQRMISFASDTERYPKGLLNHTIIDDSKGFDETKAYLEQLHNEQVSIDYYHVATINLGHAANEYMVNEQGYDSKRNVLETQSAIHGLPVYVDALQFRVENSVESPISTDLLVPEWELSPASKATPWRNARVKNSLFFFNINQPTEIHILCAYVGATPRAGTATELDWQVNGAPDPPTLLVGNPAYAQYYGYGFEATYGPDADIDDFIHEYTLIVPLSDLGYVKSETYFQTKYYTGLASTLELHYFTHDAAAGTIESIESTLSLGVEVPEFLPHIFLRENFFTPAIEDIPETVKLASKLGIDYEEFRDSVFTGDEEDPIDIGSISQAYLTFGVPINTELQVSIRYLYEFFYWLNLNDTNYATPTSHTGQFESFANVAGRKAIVFSEDSAFSRLDYIRTSTALYAGSIGAIGFCTSDSYETDVQYAQTVEIQGISQGGFITRNVTVFSFKKQIADNFYREVIVADPRLSFQLTHTKVDELRDVYVTEYADLLIPISQRLVKLHINGIKRSQLYGEAFHLRVNSYDITKLKFYEKTAFASLIRFVGIAITVYSLGTATGPVSAIYTAAYSATGTVVGAIVITLLVGYGFYAGADALFDYVAQEIGSENTYILSTVLTVASVYARSQGYPSATTWSFAANSLQASASEELESEIADFNLQLEDFQTEYDRVQAIQEQFDEAEDQKNFLLEAIGLRYTNNLNETPTEYYARTSSGVLAPEASITDASLYFETALDLPILE